VFERYQEEAESAYIKYQTDMMYLSDGNATLGANDDAPQAADVNISMAGNGWVAHVDTWMPRATLVDENDPHYVGHIRSQYLTAFHWSAMAIAGNIHGRAETWEEELISLTVTFMGVLVGGAILGSITYVRWCRAAREHSRSRFN
jgi:hypothetical protein